MATINELLAELSEDLGEAMVGINEQEMWFNYRKPRPPKRGAYYYAAKFNVPIVSFFVEIRDMDEKENERKNRPFLALRIHRRCA